MVVHKPIYVQVADHPMILPYCGLDDSESATYSSNQKDVTCKRCLKKLRKPKGSGNK